MASTSPPPPGPRFPTSVLISWLGMFCACIALITVWVMPLSVPIQILATTIFALVPLGILIYWLGGFMEHRRRNRED